jgi:hypothetical protein
MAIKNPSNRCCKTLVVQVFLGRQIVLLQQNFPQSSETLPIFGGYYAEAARKIILCSTIHEKREIRRMGGMHETIRKSNRCDWSSGRFGTCRGGAVCA